jgi:hypothetical protein
MLLAPSTGFQPKVPSRILAIPNPFLIIQEGHESLLGSFDFLGAPFLFLRRGIRCRRAEEHDPNARRDDRSQFV